MQPCFLVNDRDCELASCIFCSIQIPFQVKDLHHVVIIHGLERSTDTQDLKTYFGQYGEVIMAEVIHHACVFVWHVFPYLVS